MRSRQLDRTEALVLVVIALGCFVGAWLSYSGHPVKGSNLYAPEIPGWVHLFTFILIGVIVRLGYIGARRRRTEKDVGIDASRKT